MGEGFSLGGVRLWMGFHVHGASFSLRTFSISTEQHHSYVLPPFSCAFYVVVTAAKKLLTQPDHFLRPWPQRNSLWVQGMGMGLEQAWVALGAPGQYLLQVALLVPNLTSTAHQGSISASEHFRA